MKTMLGGPTNIAHHLFIHEKLCLMLQKNTSNDDFSMKSRFDALKTLSP